MVSSLERNATESISYQSPGRQLSTSAPKGGRKDLKIVKLERYQVIKGRLAVVTDDGTKEFLNRMIFDTSQPSVWVGGHWKDEFEGFTR